MYSIVEAEAMGHGDVELLDMENAELGREKTTTKYMTKYERARVLGTRALQIR